MIEVEGISRQFGSIVALRDVTFKIGKGEVAGLLGPNGAGKTTMMRILACFIPSTSGVARVGGLDVTRHPLEVRRKIGYSLERAPVYPGMRVIPFLRFVGEVKGMNRRQLREAIPEVLSLCGLEHVGNRIVDNLSKGYRQRLGLAQALINQPEVLILDEPTIGLDPEQVSEVRKLIRGLSGERTILLSSHILSEISMMCGKVIIMNEGRIMAVDTPENLSLLLEKRVSTNVQIEGPRETALRALNEIPGVCRVEAKEKISERIFKYKIESEREVDICSELATLALKNRWILREIQPVKMSLEEIFLEYVTKERGSQ